MAYDEGTAQRIRDILEERTEFIEKKMFGGIGFMVRGNLAVGVDKNGLMARVGPDFYGEALSMPHVREFDITGRPMKGWVRVEAAGYESDGDLAMWVDRGLNFAKTLPEK